MATHWPRFTGLSCAAIILASLGVDQAAAFDVGGLIGGVMQSAIQADQQRQMFERQQLLERQQQWEYQRQRQFEREQQDWAQRRASPLVGVPGAPPGVPGPGQPAMPRPEPPRSGLYLVDGRSVGQVLTPDSLPDDFRCHPSEQFSGSQWCRSRKRVNEVWTSTSIILSATNTITYYSKFFEAADFREGSVASEIARLSQLHSEQAHVLRMPGGTRDDGAVIATWGGMNLVPLDADTVNTLAGGGSITAGVLIDFLNNARDSAKRGLPIYRLAGGPGYYWIARVGRGGHGSLRFGIADAQSFDAPKPPVIAAAAPPAPAPSAVSPSPAVPEIAAAAPASAPQKSGYVAVASIAPVVPVSPEPTPSPPAPPPPAPVVNRQASLETAPDAAIKAESAIPQQGRRVALVIGNAAYQAVPPLENPKHDAEDVAAALTKAGFDSVTLTTDANLVAMKKALRDLAEQADHADWAMVYYAGHGIEIGGDNYLVPIDAHLASDRDAEDEAIPLRLVLDRLGGVKKLRLVVLDACREDPFAATMRRHAGTRAITRGLARFEPQVANEMVVYSAKDNQLARDGTSDGHSPFAKALIARLDTPGLEINKLFRMVTADVALATNDQQQPFVYGSTPGLDDFYFRTQ